MIVDDTLINVALLVGILRSEGFRTLSATDGVAAREMLGRQSVDLILLDVMMPGESGFETCAKLKSNPATADIPVIFLSARDDVESKVMGLKVGGVDYMAKPVHREEVLARARVHLRISETNRLLAAAHRARLEQLRSAQRSILVRPDECPEAAFAVYYKPLEETGGDFYDVTALDSEVFGYFVADVSGHGIGAAFLTSAVKALLRQYGGPLYSPEDTLRGVDLVMRQLMGDEQYLTACYARLNHRRRLLSVVSAGHPPAIVVNAEGKAQVLHMDSDPLGMFSSIVLQRKDLVVAPLDRIYLYSDGLIESEPGGARQDGIDRLVDACVRYRGEPLRIAVGGIARETGPAFSQAQDDLLLLAIEVPQ